MKLLLCHAHAREAERVQARTAEASLLLGVGKVEAASSLGRALASCGELPDGVLLFGVCGAYPARHGSGGSLAVRQLCVVAEDRLADEGVHTPDGFLGVGDMGLADAGPFASAEAWTRELAARFEIPMVRGNTVSACSGTDATSPVVNTWPQIFVGPRTGIASAPNEWIRRLREGGNDSKR